MEESFLKKKNKKNVIIYILVLLLIICICCSILGIFSNSKKDDDNVITETHTLVPTDLQIVPTSTEKSIIDSTPTIFVTSTIVPTEQIENSLEDEYFNQIYVLSLKCSSALSDISNLSNIVAENPSLIFEDTWSQMVNESLDDMELYCVAFGDLGEIPGGYEDTDIILKLAASEFQNVVDNYRIGISDIDVTAIENAGISMQKASGYFEEALTTLNK